MLLPDGGPLPAPAPVPELAPGYVLAALVPEDPEDALGLAAALDDELGVALADPLRLLTRVPLDPEVSAVASFAALVAGPASPGGAPPGSATAAPGALGSVTLTPGCCGPSHE